MALNATSIMNAIIAQLPSEWQAAWTPGKPNYDWVHSMCSGFVVMWAAATVTPSPTFSPGPVTPHSHAFISVDPAIMFAASLVYTPPAQAFTNVVCTQTAAHIAAGVWEVTLNPTHMITYGSPSALASAIASAAAVTGVGIAPFCNAFAAGLISEVTANGQQTPSILDVHIHSPLS